MGGGLKTNKMSKAKEKVSDMLAKLHPELHFSEDWLKVTREGHGKYGTAEVFWTMTARKPKTFLTYESVWFYGHSPLMECAQYGIQTRYENYSWSVYTLPTPN